MCFLYFFSGIIDDEFDDDDVTPPRSPLVVQNSNMGLSSKPLLLRPADNSPFTTGKEPNHFKKQKCAGKVYQFTTEQMDPRLQFFFAG